MLFPSASSPPQELADWLELRAISSADMNSSIQDLARELRRSATTDALVQEDGEVEEEPPPYASDPGDEKTQAAAEDAFAEIEDRRGACAGRAGGSQYPFAVDDGYLTLMEGQDRSIYLFLLLLSVCGKDAGPPGLNGEHLFEDVCAEALKLYFGGPPHANSVVFGSPRRVLPVGFQKAVDQLCRDLGEGERCRHRPTRKFQKDAKLDIVAWRDFPDRRRGKLIGFGQCATGSNWPDKVTELLPDHFCRMWFSDQPTVTPVKAFFVPHRIDPARWTDTCSAAGIVFDRCRIAASIHEAGPDLVEKCRNWSQTALDLWSSSSVRQPERTRRTSRRRGGARRESRK